MRRSPPDLRSAATVACATAFVALALAVRLAGPLPGETWLLRAITERAGTRFDDAARLVGDLSDPVPLLAGSASVAVVLGVRGRRADAGRLAVCVGIALLVNPWLKDLVGQPRPTVRTIPEPVSPLAFPAGHAANTAAVLFGLLLAVSDARRRRALLAVGIALLGLVAASRLVVGAHHPSDLVAGWLWTAVVFLLLVRGRPSTSDRHPATAPPPPRYPGSSGSGTIST